MAWRRLMALVALLLLRGFCLGDDSVTPEKQNAVASTRPSASAQVAGTPWSGDTRSEFVRRPDVGVGLDDTYAANGNQPAVSVDGGRAFDLVSVPGSVAPPATQSATLPNVRRWVSNTAVVGGVGLVVLGIGGTVLRVRARRKKPRLAL